MKRNKFYQNIGLLLAIQCFLIMQFNAIGQTSSINYNNYLSLTIQPTSYQSLKINQIEGNQLLKSTPSFGGSVYLQLIHNYNKSITFSVGLGLEIIPHYFNFSIRDSMSNSFVNLMNEEILLGSSLDYYGSTGLYASSLRYFEYDQISYNIRFSAQINLKEMGNKLSFIEITPQIKYIGNTDFSVSQTIAFFTEYPNIANVDAKVFQSYLNTTDSESFYRPLPSLSLAFGLKNLSNKKSTFQTKLFVNFVPKLISTGEFEFFELSSPNYGTIKQRINNVGLSFTYGLATKSLNKYN